MSFPGMTFFKYFASQIFPYGKHLSSALTASLLPDNIWQQKSSFHNGNCFLYFLYIYFCTLIISYLRSEKKVRKEYKTWTKHGQNMDKIWTCTSQKKWTVPVKKSRLYQDTSSFPCLGYPSYFDTI